MRKWWGCAIGPIEPGRCNLVPGRKVTRASGGDALLDLFEPGTRAPVPRPCRARAALSVVLTVLGLPWSSVVPSLSLPRQL